MIFTILLSKRLRKGLRRKLAERAPDVSRWQVIRDNVFTFESIAFGLDDYTNSILAQAIRSTDIGGVPLLTKGFTSPLTGNKIAVWSKNGDFTPSFKNVIREASEGKYTTGEFKTAVLECPMEKLPTYKVMIILQKLSAHVNPKRYKPKHLKTRFYKVTHNASVAQMDRATDF